MEFFSSLSAIILFISSCFSLSIGQQPYVGRTTNDCDNQHNSSSGLGYYCNGQNRSCQTYVTFRSTPPYSTVLAISDLFSADPSELSRLNSVSMDATLEARRLVFLPVNCSCSGEFYQSNRSYIVKGQTYLNVAENTFQGLSTCQAISNQSGNPPATDVRNNQKINVPLRCACPTKNQSDLRIKYLVSYLVSQGETPFMISNRFGVSDDSVSEANSIVDSDIYPQTTLLIPLENPPSYSQPPPPPPPPPPSPALPPSTESSKTWLYALLGSLGGCAFLLLVVGAIFFGKVFRKSCFEKKCDPISVSESFVAPKKPKEIQESTDCFGHISDIVQSIKIYDIKELKMATGGFSPSCRISANVYRGTINGELAAIKKLDGDHVSKEMTLLQINHARIIRLSGICFDQGFGYLVCEYASNGPLSAWIFNGGKSLTWTQRIQIALDVAAGLNHLHSFTDHPLVHKDINSDNILLDNDFRAKIANFGLSTTIAGHQEGHFHLTRHIVGTIGYMAPEYLENGLVSPMLDIYAFGVLLLEMFTGKDARSLRDEYNHLSEVVGGTLGDEGQGGWRDLVDSSMGKEYPSELLHLVVKIIESCLQENLQARPPMDVIVQSLSEILRLGKCQMSAP